MLRFVIIVCIAMFAGVPVGKAQEDRGTNWTRVPGTAIDLSVNASGQTYVIGQEGTPWRWDAVEGRWRRMSGTFVRISAAEGNRPWAIDQEAVVFRYNGLWWEDKDTNVRDVAADQDGNVYILKSDGSLRKWYSLRSEWQSVPLPGELRPDDKIVMLSLTSSTPLWAITLRGAIFFWDGDRWRRHKGLARAIASGGMDKIAIVDIDGFLREWNGVAQSWEIIPGMGRLRDLAVTPNNHVWALTLNGSIWASGDVQKDEAADKEQDNDTRAKPIRAPEIKAKQTSAQPAIPPSAFVESPKAKSIGTPKKKIARSSTQDKTNGAPETVTTKNKITFVNTQEKVTHFAIGGDGSVFALDGAGNVLRWTNTTKTFESFPGVLARIAVDKAGNPWGVSSLGRVFRHEGTKWQQIYNVTAADIAVGYDGTVMITQASGALLKLNDAQTAFLPVKGTGRQIAVASDGVPWLIRSDKLVQRCDVSPCKTLTQKALSIAAGPDDSLWIVSNTNKLMYLRKDKKTFEAIETPGFTPGKVAVGPNGYPWVLAEDNTVLASQFFERNETDDQRIATVTQSSGTVGSGESSSVSSSNISGFTFSKNMRFEEVDFSILSAGACPIFATDHEGIVWVHSSEGDSGGDIEKYSSAKRKFLEENTGFDGWALDAFDIGPDGEIWAITSSPSVGLFKEDNGTRTEYSVSGASAYNSVSVSQDGTIYVSVSMGGYRYLYYKEPNTQVFRKFNSTLNNIRRVSVGMGGDIWVVGANFEIMRWDGSRFEEPGRTTFNASKLSVSKLDGTVYAVKNGTSNLYKWNASNKGFDEVNNVSIDTMVVDGQGRPWLCNDTSPVIKRARG